jgi:anti-sigma B factor antagonist
MPCDQGVVRHPPADRTSKETGMDITSEKVGDVTVATIHGDNLDASNVDDFKRDVMPLVQPRGKLLLDLQHVEFVDSAGCSVILSCLRQVNAAGGELKVCAVTKPVRALFDLVRFPRILDIYNTRDEAVKAFGR